MTKISVFLIRYPVLCIKTLYSKYAFISRRLDACYENSKISGFVYKITDKLKVFLNSSFPGRVSQARKETRAQTLNNSMAVRYWFNFLKNVDGKIHFNVTPAINLIKVTRDEAYRYPVKAASWIIASAVIINVVFAFLLKVKIDLSGWVMRGVLFLVAINGISCAINWQVLKNSSFILKITRKK